MPIPEQYRKQLEQQRQMAEVRSQLSKQYDKEMASKYTRDMPTFAEWMAKRQQQPQGMADGGSTWKSPDWKPHPENDLLQPIGSSRMVGDEKLLSQDDTFSHGLSEFPSSRKSYRYLYHGEDNKPIGSMQIQTSGPRSKKAVIQNLYVAENNRRQGIASKLLERARQDFDVKHSTDLTSSGRAFAKAVKAKGGAVEPTQDEMRLALTKARRHGMYSPLEKLAVDIPRNKGTGAEFMAEISKQPGFKAEEVADRKIPMPEGKMSKIEFLRHLRKHSIPPLEEHVLDDHGDYDDALNDRANDYYGDDMDRLSPEQQRDVESYVDQNSVKYKQYQLPGGENYREMLLKLPSLTPREKEIMMFLEAQERRIPPSTFQNSSDGVRLQKMRDKQRGIGGEYQSNHWGGIPNVLAHLRLSDRESPEGDKLLHVEELQSDWHQRGRKQGYKTESDPLQKNQDGEYVYKKPDGTEVNLGKYINERKVREGFGLSNIPDAPFKKSWHELGMKHVLHHAAQNGYKGIVITPGEEQVKRWNDEGLKVHYDKKIPQFLNKFGEKFGAQVGQHVIDKGGYKVNRDSNEMPYRVESEGSPDIISRHPTAEAAWNEATKLGSVPLHHFPITEPMREKILKEGLPQYMSGGIIHKAEGGAVQPSIAQMKMEMAQKGSNVDLQRIGVNEAPNMSPKHFFPPAKSDIGMPSPGGVATPSGMPIGGIDMSKMQGGQQLMPNPLPAPPQPPQGAQPPQGGQPPQPPQGQPPMGAQQGGGNILQMTPQGQMMQALGGGQPPKPPGMAKGGQPSVDQMKAELAAKKAPAKADAGDDEEEDTPAPSKRITIKAEGPGGVTGIVVPHHMLHGRSWISKKTGKKVVVPGMADINKARAQVYGSENRDPLSLGQIGKIHKDTLTEHFTKPLKEQLAAEKESTQRLRDAKHLGAKNNTLDESEKLDTVRHETDEEGRTHVGFASKGVAGHALYTSGHGDNMKYHVINTCPGQTEGCGGGKDAKGVIDTSRGTCFAPNAESQYVHAAVRRATHEQAKHDPKMTRDWILAHTGSMREAAKKADKSNQRLLFRPNVVDETDVSSRHAIRHLNEQRREESRPDIIANSYGKTNELHDPENGYYVTHSNVGPKVKKGQEIAENVGRDKARVRNTVMAADNRGDFKNEQGNKTPPKGSYMVTDVKRGSPMAKKMEEHITHAKYWTTGRPENELSAEEKAEGPEGHFSGSGRKTSEDKAHYGHTTVEGKRFDYQRQHILHPRLVNVPIRKKNKKTGEMETKDHMIPTDSRFKDTEFLPKDKYKTKNGKEAGHILMTTPTESTSNIGHETSFTHNVNQKHIEHAMKNNGEYEIDKPEDQIKAAGKEYRAPQSIKFYAEGGSVDGRHAGFSHDDFHAFPEQNVVAQRHLSMRKGDDEDRMAYHSGSKKHVAVHKNMDTMRLELTRKK